MEPSAHTASHNVRHVTTQLDTLSAQEREISDERCELHRRIDTIYLRAPLEEEDVWLLDELEQERTLSARRARLHREIDEFRARVGLPSWREATELDRRQAAGPRVGPAARAEEQQARRLRPTG